MVVAGAQFPLQPDHPQQLLLPKPPLSKASLSALTLAMSIHPAIKPDLAPTVIHLSVNGLVLMVSPTELWRVPMEKETCIKSIDGMIKADAHMRLTIGVIVKVTSINVIDGLISKN
jgi:hypothetical protein